MMTLTQNNSLIQLTLRIIFSDKQIADCSAERGILVNLHVVIHGKRNSFFMKFKNRHD